MTWLVTAMAVAALLLWIYLLFLLLRLFQRQSKQDAADRAERERRKAEEAALRAAREAEERRKAEQKALEARAVEVKQVLESDPLLAQVLLKLAGQEGHNPLRDTSEDRERVLEIARRVTPASIQTLRIAATQEDVEFDLDKRVRREKALHPTQDIEPVPMTGMEQLSEILPEQLMQDDEQFYRALAHQELLVLQPFERKIEQKTLHILLDVSGSMDKQMSGGVPRHNWSRGITVSLLLRAVRGDANYLLRPFDGAPHKLMRAESPEEALALIELVLNTGASGGSTHIYSAVHQAVVDVEALADGGDILLITDGDDTSMDNITAVKQLLGSKVRLHVASIGKQSPALKAVATTYHVFN